MKIDYPELQDRYDDFWEVQQNQLEIFGEIEAGFDTFCALESFQGASAKSAKAYIEEVHSKVVDTFEMLLMEYETRMFLMKGDFSENVDDGASALLETEYIKEANEKVALFEKDFDVLHTELNNAIKPVAEIMDITSPFDATTILDDYADVKKSGKKTITNLESFDTTHKTDMDSIDSVFANLDQAFTFIMYRMHKQRGQLHFRAAGRYRVEPRSCRIPP